MSDLNVTLLNELKPGPDEKLYENALVIQLAARGQTVEQQREYPVYYRGHFIEKLVPDLIADSKVIADPQGGDRFQRCSTSSPIPRLMDWKPRMNTNEHQ